MTYHFFFENTSLFWGYLEIFGKFWKKFFFLEEISGSGFDIRGACDGGRK